MVSLRASNRVARTFPETYVLRGGNAPALVGYISFEILPDGGLAYARRTGTQTAFRIDYRVVCEQGHRLSHVAAGQGVKQLLLDGHRIRLRDGPSHSDRDDQRRGKALDDSTGGNFEHDAPLDFVRDRLRSIQAARTRVVCRHVIAHKNGDDVPAASPP
jgi:hypothetical protein